MRDITVHTKLIPLLGMPLGHSYSIQLQNRIFEHENLYDKDYDMDEHNEEIAKLFGVCE